MKTYDGSDIVSLNTDILTVFSSSYDGYLRCSGINDEYYLVHDASYADEIDTVGSGIQFGQQDLGAGSSHNWYIYRGFLFFDTSFIPSDATITSVVFNFVIAGIYYRYIDRELMVFYDPDGVYPHLELELGDYDLDHYYTLIANFPI